jgi:hypothetical protein
MIIVAGNRIAVAVAPLPPPPVIVSVGADVHAVPPKLTEIPVTAPAAIVEISVGSVAQPPRVAVTVGATV